VNTNLELGSDEEEFIFKIMSDDLFLKKTTPSEDEFDNLF
jgi:hypothetical protein